MKSPENSGPKQGSTRFKAGRSGNPAGKPKGARNRTSLAIDALLEGEAETLTRKAVELAMGGDTTALRLCMERLCPPRKDRPIAISLPKVTTAKDAVGAHAAVLAAVAGGEITPGEGGDVMRLLESFSRTIEASELKERLAVLEQQIQK